MEFSPNPFSVTLLLSGVFCLFLALIVRINKGKSTLWFMLLMLSITVWAISYALELSSTSFEQMLFIINFEYLGISFVPAFWIIFILKFVGKDSWLTPINTVLLFVIPVTTQIMVITNDQHYLHYQSIVFDDTGAIPVTRVERGVWYSIHTTFFYIMMVWGIVLLIRRFRHAEVIFQKQSRAIFLGALVPWIVNLFYLLGYNPFPNIDLTPFAFLATASIAGVALLKWRLFDIVPVARDKVIDAMHDGVMVVDSRSRIVDVNKKMTQFLKKTSNELMGKELTRVFPMSKEWFNDTHNIGIETRIDNGGTVTHLELKMTSLTDRNTVYSGELLLFRDITERRNAQENFRYQAEELGRLNKLKDRLFSIIAHDLRGPLTNLKEILELNKKGAITGDEFNELLPHISKDVNYTVGLLENLLYWSKSQLQGERIILQDFDLRQLSDKVLPLLGKRAQEKGIKLKNGIDEGTMVYADVDMIELVIRNLVSNAVKFCSQGDHITVLADEDDTMITVEVRDTGIGIEEDKIDKLFGLETFTTRGTGEEQGTGLGLLLCREFVEKNGGQIWVESRPHIGSSFFFSLPKP